MCPCVILACLCHLQMLEFSVTLFVCDVTTSFSYHRQGQMVSRGTYSELQRSGLDLTTLLKEDEGQEEEKQSATPIPGTISHCSHTVSDNSMSSMSSLSSSRYSLIEGTEPHAVVGIFEIFDQFLNVSGTKQFSTNLK